MRVIGLVKEFSKPGRLENRPANPCYNIVTMAEKRKSPQGSEFWQIIFPTLVGATMIFGLGIWFGITGSTGSLARFAEISTVLLVVPTGLAVLLMGLLLGGAAYLFGRLIEGIPPLTGKVLDFLEKIRAGVKQVSSAAARLVIEPAAVLAIFKPRRGRQDPEIPLND